MRAKIRGIDDCIEVLEDVADRLTSGTLTAADARAIVRTAEGSAELIGLKGEVLKLELDAGRMGIIPAPTSEQRFLGRQLLELEEGMTQFRATRKRVKQLMADDLGKKPD
jgi:hypothetical protein